MKTRKTTATRRPQTPPAVADPHLVALLSFISGVDPTHDAAGRYADGFAHAYRSAVTMLSVTPLTVAFGFTSDRPEVYDEVSQCVKAAAGWHLGADKALAQFAAVEDARRENSDDDVDTDTVRDMLPVYVDQSLLLGACLMYRMLTGGVR